MNKKLKILLFILSFLIINNTSALVLSGPEYGINKTTFNDNFGSSVNIGSNQEINIKITTLISNDSKQYSINFPAGFQYTGNYDYSGTNCKNFSINNTTSTNFKFSFSGAGICVGEVIFSYKSNSDINSGTKNISILDGTNYIGNMSVIVENGNVLNKAESYDTNDNGFIDQIKLYFTKDISGIFSSSGLTIGGLTPTFDSYSGSITYLNIDDNLLDTQTSISINDTDGGIFDQVGKLNNYVIIDKAGSVLTTIDGTDILTSTGVSYIKIGSGTTFGFNESFYPNFETEFSLINSSGATLTGSTSSGTFSFPNNYKNLVLNYDNINNYYGNYFLNSSGATDWAGNTSKINNEKYILYLDGTIESSCIGLPENAYWLNKTITQTWNGISFQPSTNGYFSSSNITNNCVFTCESAYEWDGNSCKIVYRGGGGGGGGGSSNYTKTTTKTEVSEDKEEITNNYDINNELSNEAIIFFNDLEYLNKELAKSYIDSINYKGLNKINLSLLDLINDFNNEIFSQLDNNYKQNYQKLLVNYINLLENINKYLKTNDKSLLITAKNNYTEFIKYSNLTKNFYKNYVNIIIYKNQEILNTYNENYNKALLKIQNKIIDKLIYKKTNNIISNEEFKNAINNYNDFILYFSIWKKTNNDKYKNLSINSLKEVINIYNKKN